MHKLLLALVPVAECLTSKVARHGNETQQNLCINGRLAPELMLIGAAKASTTTFAQNVEQSPSIREPKCDPSDLAIARACTQTLKELHFFDYDHRYRRGQDHWLSHYPPCDQSARLFATDMTPGYLFKPEVPSRVANYFGSQLSRVKFVVLLREPVSSISSFFYYLQQDKNSADTFQDLATQIMTNPEARKLQYFQNIMYADAFERWFAEVKRSQFIISPMQYNTAAKNGHPIFWEFVLTHLGAAPLPADAQVVEHALADEHPPVPTDADAETLSKLTYFVNLLTGPEKLAELFATENPEDAPNLFGYEGAANDRNAIAEWLADGW